MNLNLLGKKFLEEEIEWRVQQCGQNKKGGVLGKKLEPEKYPLLNMLYSNGIKSLLSYAVEKFNFQPDKQYLNKCHLCLDIRKFFISKKNLSFVELQPLEYYTNLDG